MRWTKSLYKSTKKKDFKVNTVQQTLKIRENIKIKRRVMPFLYTTLLRVCTHGKNRQTFILIPEISKHPLFCQEQYCHIITLKFNDASSNTPVEICIVIYDICPRPEKQHAD